MRWSEYEFWNKIKVSGPDECWEWQRARIEGGYGTLRWNGKQVCAHVVAYILINGPIPKGKQILHRCDNPPCCNPAHLRAGTQGENVREALAKGRQGGELHPRARITKAMALSLRERYNQANGRHGIISIMARETGFNRSHVSRIVHGQRWAVNVNSLFD
jgi:hypothetical protein